MPKKNEFARGIPDKHVYGEPTRKLKPGQLATYVLQHHRTRRRPTQPHYDLRIGTPKTNLFSWAIPGAQLPEPGKRKLAPQTQVHAFPYGEFEGPIREGYGSGFVRRQDRGQVLITKTTPNAVHFTIAHTRIPTRFALVRIGTGRGGRDWLLIRKAEPKTVEGVGDKPHVKLIEAPDLDSALEQAEEVQEKIDGAHGIYEIGEKGKIEAYSVRPRKTGEPIRHTERLGLSSVKVPESLSGTSLRGEMYGVANKGKAITFNEVSGILNASIAKALEKQRAKKIQMQNAIHGLIRYKGQDVSKMGPQEKRELLRGIIEQLPKSHFHSPRAARTAKEKAKLIDDIRTGKNKRTGEGVIMHMPGGKVWKYKRRADTTGYVTGTFPGKGKRQKTVGGLTFSRDEGPGGRVGSGLTEEQLAEIAKNLKPYLGRPMRIAHQEVTPKGMLRAPVFKGWETDKPMRKAAVIKREGNRYVLYTRDGKKVLGRHSSKEKAMAQERAIQAHKHADAPLQFVDKWGHVKAEALVEIADTPTKRRQGLSKRAHLPRGHGMFFDRPGGYWMKDVNFPLDLVFMDKQGRILEKQHMPVTCDPDPWKPIYVAKSAGAAHALELPAGWFEKHDLQVGDIIRLAQPLF